MHVLDVTRHRLGLRRPGPFRPSAVALIAAAALCTLGCSSTDSEDQAGAREPAPDAGPSAGGALSGAAGAAGTAHDSGMGAGGADDGSLAAAPLDESCGMKTWPAASADCWNCLCATCPGHLDACSDGSCWETIECGVANSCFGTDVITETTCLLNSCMIGQAVIALDTECLVPMAPESVDGTVRRACDIECGVHSEAQP